MTEFTAEEKQQLEVFKEAIQMIFDHGKWARVPDKDGLFWCIPEEIADTVDAMTEEFTRG